MAQFLRPDSNVTQSGFTNGFANIDEAVASDADFAYGTAGVVSALEVGLSDPSAGPGVGASTIRYRIAKVTSAGTLSGTGNTPSVTVDVVQGGTVIATDAARTPTGAWVGYAWSPDLSGVTDWTDVRLRFSVSNSGGNTSNRRSAGISWAEVEAPDAPAGIAGSMAAAETGGDNAAGAGAAPVSGVLGPTESDGDAFAGIGTVADPGPISGTLAAVEAAPDAFAGPGAVQIAGVLSGAEAGSDAAVGAGAAVIAGAFAVAEAANDNTVMAASVAISGALALAESGFDSFIGTNGGGGLAPVCRRWMRMGLRR